MNKVIPSVVAVMVSFGAGLASAEEGAQASTMSTTATEQAAPAAQESTNPFAAKFMRLDANRDGAIDKSEAKSDKSLAKAFSKVAKKGKLNEQEYIKWAESQKPKG